MIRHLEVTDQGKEEIDLEVNEERNKEWTEKDDMMEYPEAYEEDD